MTGDRTDGRGDIVTKLSPRSVADTVARLTGILGPLTDALVAG